MRKKQEIEAAAGAEEVKEDNDVEYDGIDDKEVEEEKRKIRTQRQRISIRRG